MPYIDKIKSGSAEYDIHDTRVNELETVVGDSTSGLVKDVADLGTAINNIKGFTGDLVIGDAVVAGTYAIDGSTYKIARATVSGVYRLMDRWDGSMVTGIAVIDVGNPIASLFIEGDIYVSPITYTGDSYTLTKKAEGGGSVVAYEGTSLLPTGLSFESWTLHRGIKDGNILWIVVSGNIKNSTESSITISNAFVEISIPETIASNIYRMDGSTVNNAPTSQSTVCAAPGCEGSSSMPFIIYSPSALKLQVLPSQNITIGGSGSTLLNFRFPIFFDIGTVQQ